MTFNLSRRALGDAEYQRQRRIILKSKNVCLYCTGPNDTPHRFACSECRRVHAIKEKLNEV